MSSQNTYSEDVFDDSLVFSSDKLERSTPALVLVDAALQQSLQAFKELDSDEELDADILQQMHFPNGDDDEEVDTSSSLFIIEDYYFSDEDDDNEPLLQDGFAFSTFTDRSLQAQLHVRWVSPIHELLSDISSIAQEKNTF